SGGVGGVTGAIPSPRPDRSVVSLRVCGPALGCWAGTWLVALVLSGCGFQLRTWELASTFETARIEADRGVDLDLDLARALESAGVRLVDSEADVVVRLSDQRDDWRSVAVTRGARTADYELAVQVGFRVTDREGNELAPPRVLRSERVARLDRDNLVGSSDERRLLDAEARDELVGRMVRTLDALSRRPDPANADSR
ncbi:MAG: LPS assembly lipoprotein LptE, partial [Gammaproteobacteria bacterium]|nr:LPS assembly lipoprotein LptE [Gammaproteobacteria bacterium]